MVSIYTINVDKILIVLIYSYIDKDKVYTGILFHFFFFFFFLFFFFFFFFFFLYKYEDFFSKFFIF